VWGRGTLEIEDATGEERGGRGEPDSVPFTARCDMPSLFPVVGRICCGLDCYFISSFPSRNYFFY
jgi:hypothetical protein